MQSLFIPENYQNAQPTNNEGEIDFTACPREKTLRPLRMFDVFLSDISSVLDEYLSVLNQGGSIALNRGEKLHGVSLARSLESIFSTKTPQVTEGPSITWTALVLFATFLRRPITSGDWVNSC